MAETVTISATELFSENATLGQVIEQDRDRAPEWGTVSESRRPDPKIPTFLSPTAGRAGASRGGERSQQAISGRWSENLLYD